MIVILTKFHKNRLKISDFLLVAYLGASVIFSWQSLSTLFKISSPNEARFQTKLVSYSCEIVKGVSTTPDQKNSDRLNLS